MQTLEICDLWLVPGVHERFESRFDQRADAAAQHGLLPEQIGFGFLRERGLDHPGARDADPFRVRQRERARMTGGVLLDREERRRARSLDEELAHAVTGRLRRDHGDVDVRADGDRPEADVEAVREHQHVAWSQIRLDFLAVHLALRRVGDEDHHDVSPFRDVGHVAHGQARGLRPRARPARRRKPHLHANAAVLQVQCMRVPLRSVANHRNFAIANQRQIRVVVVIHCRHQILHLPRKHEKTSTAKSAKTAKQIFSLRPLRPLRSLREYVVIRSSC